MPKKTRTYYCDLCKKEYASNGSLWFHNKKYHSDTITTNNNSSLQNDILPTTYNNSNSLNDQLLTTFNNINSKNNNSQTINNNQQNNKIYCCKYCNKSYNIQQSRWKHEQTCKNKTDLISENIKLKQELELVKNNQLVPVNSNINNNTNNQTNNGNILKNSGTINNNLNNTVNNNNTVTINKIGTEPYKIKTKDIKMIANDGMNGPITCARQLNFNKNKPENHSYCITSLEGEYCKAINHETQQPEIVTKKEIVDQVFESAYRFIESIAAQIKEDDRLREKLSKHEIKEIERIVANKNKYYEKKNRKTFYNSINSMGYNYRDLVLSTWKLLKPLEENLIEDNESTDSEFELKEVTEFPDINELSDSDSDEEITLRDLIKI